MQHFYCDRLALTIQFASASEVQEKITPEMSLSSHYLRARTTQEIH